MIIPALITLANKINEVEQEEIRQAGFSDFICKPIMQNTIHFYIKKYMSVDLVKKKSLKSLQFSRYFYTNSVYAYNISDHIISNVIHRTAYS